MEKTIAGSDATLKSMVVIPAPTGQGLDLHPKLYFGRVPNSVAAVTIAPEANDPGAGVTVQGVAVAGGEASARVELACGLNVISVDVTAPDGKSSGRYTVKLIRAHPAPNWVKVRESSPWLPRDSAGELVFNGRMWLFGGYTPEVIGDVWNSPDGLNWAKVGNLPCKSGVNIPVNFVYDNKMWVVCNGGELCSSADGINWTIVTEQAPWRGRYAAGGVAFAGKMWVMGGCGPGLFNDVWSSTDGVQWTQVTANAPWAKRQLFSMVAVYQDKIWIMGGGVTNYHPFKAYTDVWNSPDGKNWTQVTDNAPWPARIWSSSAVYRNRLWVLGGFRAEPTWNNFDDAWYSADGASWARLETETMWSSRHELSAYVFADKLWVVSGNSWPLVNDVWCLDIPGLAFLTQPVVEEIATAEYTYRARADFNKGGGKVKYRLVESPAWLSVAAESGVIRGTPATAGEYPVTVEAYDDAGETARQSYKLNVFAI